LRLKIPVKQPLMKEPL